MANRHSTTPSVSTQDKPFSKSQLRALMENENFALLHEFVDISGTPIEVLFNQALDDYIQCTVRARAEILLKDAKRAQRAEAKAEEDREIAIYLAKLESDLDPLLSPL